MPDAISIVIPAYNQLEYCRLCIESIQAHTRRDYRLILVDNGSTDGVAEYFDSVPGAHVIHNAVNLGFAAGVNKGIEAATGHVLLLNSDTIVPEGWLTRLETGLLEEDVGMVGPVTNEASGAQRIEAPEFESWDDLDRFAANLARESSGQVLETVRLVGFCLLIRDKVIQEVGLFDEQFGIGNCEDDDYCLRVMRAGYRLRIQLDNFVFHFGGRTFSALVELGHDYRAGVLANVKLLLEKWKEYGTDTPLSREYVRQLNRRARDAHAGGDSIEALKILGQAIQADPGFALNYNDLGAILWELGEHKRAHDAFSRCVELDPAHKEAQENLENAAKVLEL